MFCPKCGKEISDSVIVCPKCGTRIHDTKTTNKIDKKEMEDFVKKLKDNLKKDKVRNFFKNFKNNKKFAIGALGVLVLIVVVILVSGRKTSINLNDYLSVGFDGYDTVGTAYADFDYEKFMNKYEEKLKWNNSYLKKLERSAENENFTNSFLAEILFEYTTGTPAELLYEYVINAGLLDVRSNLSNGDTVTWEWSISEDSQKEMEKMLDCKLIFSDQEFKVQGLEKADTVDPFSILQVEYEGISPNGSAYLQSNAKDEFESMIQFETDKSNGLSNGDILTVSVNDDNADYLLSNYGKILSPLQKEYTVEGLDEYVGSWNELTDDFKAMLKADSEDKIYA